MGRNSDDGAGAGARVLTSDEHEPRFEGDLTEALETAFGRVVAVGAWYMHFYPAEAVYFWPLVYCKRLHLHKYADYFEERAAIHEHEGRFNRDEAEVRACLECLRKLAQEHAREFFDVEAAVRAWRAAR